jgi:hypothetical protein
MSSNIINFFKNSSRHELHTLPKAKDYVNKSQPLKIDTNSTANIDVAKALTRECFGHNGKKPLEGSSGN